jgi:deoxyadenosine/deoxycytidine kinase
MRRGEAHDTHPAYLERLNRLYNEWIDDWTACPVLRIDMEEIDFQTNAHDFERIADLVSDALRVEESE